tara:strand:+ start:280 stop:1068 length:789 start_codon:yes stop_codon:yes gene_type:complete
MKIIVTSGGFDPLHAGHIEYLKSAKSIGDHLIVALNSDEWLKQKKGKNFMNFENRFAIIENLEMVDEVISFEDDNIGSCKDALLKVKEMYPNDDITFCNGGDRNKDNIPEMDIEKINFKFDVGGKDKINSSSSIIKNFLYDNETRVWGEYFNLFIDKGIKVKNLIIEPEKGMSFQRHKKRNEIWFIHKGSCIVNYSDSNADCAIESKINNNEIFIVNKNCWHQIINPYKQTCHIIEIQYGEYTEEDDIERLFFYEESYDKNN